MIIIMNFINIIIKNINLSNNVVNIIVFFLLLMDY